MLTWYPKVCPVCHREFTTRKKRQITCSKSCANQRHKTFRLPIESRFWSRIQDAKDPDSCWLWLAGRTKRGYGLLRSGNEIYAHRISYLIAHGSIPEGMDILHKCDNPPCVNPAHLFPGTAKTNADDMVAKGRNVSKAPIGVKNPCSKLTQEHVDMIRAEYNPKIRNGGELARRCGVARSVVYGAASGKRYRE